MASNPVLYEVNTRVWLRELGATLAQVPDAELDRWAALGFQWIWLMGVWTTGDAGREISRSHPDWRAGYRETLGESLREEDIIGSPFAVREYAVDPALGGDAGLAELRRRLHDRGMWLMLDLVPNHTARDHAWVAEHPAFYVQGTEGDLESQPFNYCRVGTPSGARVLAFGRDPYFHGWPDTLQLDYRHPRLREAMTAELLRIAGQCDGLRCDMAMLLLPQVFGQTWKDAPPPAEGPAGDESFWPGAIARVRSAHPEFLFVAEVYWGYEWELQQQGFDYTYDKRLYDLLREGNAEGVRGHLTAEPDFQRRLARFLENHDEPRAAATFPPPVHAAAAVVSFLAPGLRLLHEGQLEGRRVKTSVHLGRRPDEPADAEIAPFYTRLLECLRRPEAAGGEWRLLECGPASEHDPSWRQLIVFCRESAHGRLLAAVNFAPHPGQCRVPLPFAGLRGRQWVLRDVLGAEEHLREGDELVDPGLYLALPPWGYPVFEIMDAENA
ncbi:MAG TPA: alpha-amylase family glycosyl hydrolase [Longimicrobium sp.]|nr:alpha-amylase family glycosyl hydrolase [Longimicrobium sp.]